MTIKGLLIGCGLLSACTLNVNGDPIATSTIPAISTDIARSLDAFASDVEANATSMRVVDVGPSFTADRLHGFYAGDALHKIDGIYDGITQTHVVIYVMRDGAVPTALLIETISSPSEPPRTERYYMASGTVVKRDNAASEVIASSARESNDVKQFYSEFVSAIDRANRGIPEDPAQFQHE